MTTGAVLALARGGAGSTEPLALALAAHRKTFRLHHWPIAFPDVFTQEGGGFDVILGNPPYVSVQSNIISKRGLALLKALYPTLEKIGDYAALFVERVTSLLTAGGRFGMVLPATILVNLSFAALRKLLLDSGLVTDIVHLGDGAFEGAVVPTCLVTFVKGPSAVVETRVALRDPKSSVFRRKVARLRDIAMPPNFQFAVEQDDASRELIARIVAGGKKLGDIVDIKEGIKTGDDKEFVSDLATGPLSLPVVRGRHIERFAVREHAFITYDVDRLSRPQRLEMFQVPEKLFIRRVGTTLTAARDTAGYLCLHTLYVARARPGVSLPLRYLVALLNSALMGWIYDQTNMRKGDQFAEVRIHALNALPVIEPNREDLRRVLDAVEGIEAVKENSADGSDVSGLLDDIDKVLWRIHGLSDAEVAMIASFNRVNR